MTFNQLTFGQMTSCHESVKMRPVKGWPVVELDGAVGYGVVLEPHEVEVKNRRKRGEDYALLSVLEKTGWCTKEAKEYLAHKLELSSSFRCDLMEKRIFAQCNHWPIEGSTEKVNRFFVGNIIILLKPFCDVQKNVFIYWHQYDVIL